MADKFNLSEALKKHFGFDKFKGEQKEIAWGAQIRSYVFMPYTLAKDHRTGYEMGNIGEVMDGDLEGFVTAYLQKL